MYFVSGPCSVDVRFEGPIEVMAVRASIREQNDYLRLIQGEEAIDKYDKNVERWRGYSQTYSTRTVEDLEYLTEALGKYADEYITEAAVTHLLDIKLGRMRTIEAAKRYQMGYEAGRILRQIEMHIALKDPVEMPEDY